MIIERIKQLIENEGCSVRSFEEKIGTSQGVINKSIKSKGDIKGSVLEKIVEKHPHISTEWLLSGKGSMLKSNTDENKYSLPTQEVAQVHEKPTTYVVDKQGSELVPVTDISVAAGTGYFNSDHISEEDVIQLPPHMLKQGYHLCVRVKGPSMSPTLQDSGYVIIRLLERSDWPCIRDEHIYVVSDMEGKAFLKRIKNRFKQGFITLMSDNPDKATYSNFNLQHDEIHTIWHAEWYLSAKMPNIHSQYYSRLQRLEDKYDLLADKLKHIK